MIYPRATKIKLYVIAVLSMMLAFSPSTLQAQKKKKKKKKMDEIVLMKTTLGDIHIQLFDETPKHKANFIKLAKEGFFNETSFHRVIKNFMIQGGDPNSKPGGEEHMIGRGGPGYTIEAEILPQFKHDKGMLAAARQSDQVNPERRSSGSQFYIVQNETGTPHLDGSYTIFGKVIRGIEVVDAVADQKVDRRGNRPLENISMTVEILEMKRKKIEKEYGITYEGEEDATEE